MTVTSSTLDQVINLQFMYERMLALLTCKRKHRRNENVASFVYGSLLVRKTTGGYFWQQFLVIL